MARSLVYRLEVLSRHFISGNCDNKRAYYFHPTSFASQQEDLKDVELEPPPLGMETIGTTLFTDEAVDFLAKLVKRFDKAVDEVLRERIMRKCQLDQTGDLPCFHDSPEVQQGKWKVAPVPQRLQNRHLDLGDVSPSDTDKFTVALNADVQGIQTDFDDGHCPTWRNQLQGLYNVYCAVHGQLHEVPNIECAPVLMLRPRAWNMIEHNMLVCGKEVPGPLFDFGLLMYHNALPLMAAKSGPFFYLSKIEGAREARLWNDIFTWTQEWLGIPVGTIKACVLIENVLASFEMEEILFELKEHSLGLNCGIWDYSASFVNKFGHREDFVLPDRNKYVNMERHFLKSYMDLVVKTCHQRGTHATGGMAALLLPEHEEGRHQVIKKVCKAKLNEINSGVDGFMVYDPGLVPHINKLWTECSSLDNQLSVLRPDVSVQPYDLLQMPSGGVTLAGLKHNIAVGILFIKSWLQGQGHYFYRGAVEDSATAEISRSQVWQWIRHQAHLEDDGRKITRHLVHCLIDQFIQDSYLGNFGNTDRERWQLRTAATVFEEIVLKRDFPEFITTYLNLDHSFLESQKLYL